MAVITFDASQFSIIFLLCLVGYCLFMGYSRNDKTGGWFILFGGIFSFSLMSGILSMFSALWLFLTPAIFLFSIKFMYDGILQILWFRKQKKKKG